MTKADIAHILEQTDNTLQPNPASPESLSPAMLADRSLKRLDREILRWLKAENGDADHIFEDIKWPASAKFGISLRTAEKHVSWIVFLGYLIPIVPREGTRGRLRHKISDTRRSYNGQRNQFIPFQENEDFSKGNLDI